MSIGLLSVQSLRNIEALSFKPNSRLNVIYGKNASGKTSLLEAIYLLGRGKSFRSALSRSIIQKGQESLTVFGQLNMPSGLSHKLGIQITAGKFKAKLDGGGLNKSSDLAKYLPLLFISPDADKLINSSPRQRRRFLDWGLFHVEQSFLSIWQRYNRTLHQRNMLLKQGQYSQLDIWDRQFLELSVELNQLRSSYVNNLAKVTARLVEQLSDISTLKIVYKPGWPKHLSFEEALLESRGSDIKMGFTQRGPHRADLDLKVEGRAAAGFLSGGQQKILAASLLLAQATIFNDRLENRCILLVDDLPSELDQYHRIRFMNLLYNSGSQLFITATAPELLNSERYEERSVFHVEHGVLLAK